MEKIDDKQFGTIPNSSTTHALISMLHTWTKGTDGNGSTTRVVLFDFRKAFDLIDHCILHGQVRAGCSRSVVSLLRNVVNSPHLRCVRAACCGLSSHGCYSLSSNLLQTVATELQQRCWKQTVVTEPRQCCCGQNCSRL